MTLTFMTRMLLDGRIFLIVMMLMLLGISMLCILNYFVRDRFISAIKIQYSDNLQLIQLTPLSIFV